jgi:hypothetical protein
VEGRDGTVMDSMTPMTGSGEEIILTNNRDRDDRVWCDHKGSQ